MDVNRLLARIGYTGPLAPTFQTLAGLQERFLLAVPFENLDVHVGRKMAVDPALRACLRDRVGIDIGDRPLRGALDEAPS
ncbi:MAG: hypothetical protein Kow0010_10080 [Dehalococcoidia bacterium]